MTSQEMNNNLESLTMTSQETNNNLESLTLMYAMCSQLLRLIREKEKAQKLKIRVT